MSFTVTKVMVTSLHESVILLPIPLKNLPPVVQGGLMTGDDVQITQNFMQIWNIQVSTEEFLFHVKVKWFLSYQQKGLICKNYVHSL